MSYTARAVILDIEGTIGDIDFVKNIMFPMTKEKLPLYLKKPQQAGITSEIDEVKKDIAAEQKKEVSWVQQEEVLEYLINCIDEDRKYTPLKAIQGKIWAEAFLSGQLVSHFYDDVLPALKRFSEHDLLIAVYSSGSIAAQKLYFKFSSAGDLSGFVRAWFDTRSGPKTDPASYQHIAADLGLPAGELLFFTDNLNELEAATQAGWQTAQLLRDNVLPADNFDQHPSLHQVHIKLPGDKIC